MSIPKTITEQCQKIRSENRRGLMTHIIVWYPDLVTSEAIADIMIDVWVDFLEFQIPFSDPMADGPTFMHANSVAVKNWIMIEDCFVLMQKLRQTTIIPLIFMGYYNSVFHYWIERFCEKAKESGCSGVIFPDYPIDHENHEGFLSACKKNTLDFVPVLNPAATEERVKKIADLKPPLLYYGMRKGITGAKATLDPDLDRNIQSLQKYFSCPIAVGWGISTPEHIRDLPPAADIAIIWSKTTDIYNMRQSLEDVRQYATSMIEAGSV